MALNSTAKDSAANSYCSQAFADAYFDSRLNSTPWSSNSDKQENALITATNRLEQEKYKGTRTTSTQALKFPRVGLVDDDGVTLSADVVPIQVCQAQCELALALLAGGTSDITAGTGLEAFKSLAVGPIRLDLQDPVTSGSDDPKLYPRVPGDPANSVAVSRWQLPFQVQRLLRAWLITDVPKASAGGWGAVRLSKS
jgi:hypothetical protein